MQKRTIKNKTNVWNTLLHADIYYYNGILANPIKKQNGQIELDNNMTITINDLNCMLVQTDKTTRSPVIYLTNGASMRAVKGYEHLIFTDEARIEYTPGLKDIFNFRV